MSQNKISDFNFQQVDMFARSVQYENNLVELTTKLTAPYSDSLYKLRAIFIWLTENIEYDYKLVNSGDNRWTHFSCKGKKEICAQAKQEWENGLLEHILNSKKAVCSGYSFLFKKMCSIVGIQNEMIPGYTKKGPQHIGLPLNVSHDWNIIKLKGETFVCDVTWASGGVKVNEETGKLEEFVKHYQNYYWLTPLNKFARNHHPKDDKWISGNNATKESFFNAPYFYPGELSNTIERNFPDSGVIKSKVGDTIHFELTGNYLVQKIQVTTNNKKNTDMLFTGKSLQSNNVYKFDYIVKENSLYYIDILFDLKKVLRYRIKY